MAKAKQQASIAEKRAVYDSQKANEEIESLKYAKRQAAKEMARLRAAASNAKEVEQKNQGDSGMRAMEEVDDAQRAVRTEKDEVENWNSNVASIGAETSRMLKQKKASHANLLEVQAQEVWAQKQQALAEKQYKMKKAMVAQDVTSLKYVKAKYEGEKSKLKLVEAAARSADESVRKSEAIRGAETRAKKR